MKGLSRGAIATGLLEGVKADTKTRGFYTSSAPSMKVKPTSSCDGIDMVSMAREQSSFAQARVVVVSAAGSPPYIHGLAPYGLQSPGRLINSVRLGD